MVSLINGNNNYIWYLFYFIRPAPYKGVFQIVKPGTSLLLAFGGAADYHNLNKEWGYAA